MEGQTDPRWLVFKLYLDLTQTNILSKFESYRYQKSIQVIAAHRKCGRTDRRTDGQTDPRWPILELDQDLTQKNILAKFESFL